MKELFKRTTLSIICSSIIAFIIGLIMVICPGLTLEAVGIIAGIYIIANGFILIAMDCRAKRLYIPFDGFMTGLLSIIMGIFLIAMPNILSTILTLVLGVWIIFSSANILKLSMAVRNLSSKWIALFLLGILDMVAGIVILFNPFASSISITILAGIAIMVHSVMNIVDMAIIRRDVKNITKAIEESFKTTK